VTAIRLKRGVLLVPILAFAACAIQPPAPSAAPRAWGSHVVPLASVNGPVSVAYLGPSLIASVWGGAAADRPAELGVVAIDPDSGSVTPLDVHFEDPSCSRIDEFSPNTGRGWVAWIWACMARGGSDSSYKVVSLSERDGEPEVVGQFEAAGLVTSIALDPVNHLPGVAFVGSRICDTIVGVTESGLEPIAAEVQGEAGSFHLDDPDIRTDCRDTGRAGYPAVSADGTVAFLASTRAIGREGPARLEVPMDLFLMRPGESPVRHPLSVTNPGGIAWSPSGEELVVGGVDASGATGVWLYRPATQAVVKVSNEPLRHLSWSSDGDRVVGVRSESLLSDGDSELVILSVAN
jgi:hypothetical protein